MRLQSVVLLTAVLLTAGCSDPGSPCYLQAAVADLPAADFENLSRTCNWPRRNVPPVAAETGDVWPSPPEHVPTMLDVQRQAEAAGHADEPLRPAGRRPNDFDLCRPAATAGAPPGVALGLCYRPAAHERPGPA